MSGAQSRVDRWGDGPERSRVDCREDLQHLYYKNEETGDTAPYRCDSWDCACCGHRMKMNLLEGVDQLVQERPEMSRFLTLTVDPSRHVDREVAHADIGAAWNRLRTFLQRRYGDFSYVWVREETDAGWPHLHVIVSRYLPQQDIAAAWDRTGMGRVVDIQSVNARKAGHYLAKYLAKDAMAHLPDGVHRYGSSADIDLGVRGGSTERLGPSPWYLATEDDLTGVEVEAGPSDFRRRRPPPD